MNKTARTKRLMEKTSTYNDFVQQIEIVDLHLVSAKIDNLGYPESPPRRRNTVRVKASYQNAEGFFEVFHNYYLTVKDDEKGHKVAKLSVLFSVTYATKKPMTDEIFDIFDKYNLPLNTWPYFREFAQNSFARMNWLGLVAPTYKTLASLRKAK